MSDPILLSSLSGGDPAPPTILLTDLLSEVSVLQQQETSDRAKMSALTSPDLSSIRTNLVAWVASGFRGSCDLVRMDLSPPNVCSDGVSRNLFDYLAFLSGKTLAEHLQSIQTILPDFEIGYRCSRTELVVCAVSVKAS